MIVLKHGEATFREEHRLKKMGALKITTRTHFITTKSWHQPPQKAWNLVKSQHPGYSRAIMFTQIDLYKNHSPTLPTPRISDRSKYKGDMAMKPPYFMERRLGVSFMKPPRFMEVKFGVSFLKPPHSMELRIGVSFMKPHQFIGCPCILKISVDIR